MSYLIWQEDWAIWGACLALGFPLLVVVLGELIQRLQRRDNPLVSPLRGTLYLVLPTLTMLLFLTQVFELTQNMVWKMSATLFWICLINTGLLMLDVILFEEADATTWRAHVSSLLRDLSRFFLVVVGAAFVLSSIWDADLGKLLSAIGIGSMLIGLALQDTMKNLITGITLLAHRTMKLGDWLQVGDVIGEVVEMNWRCVHLVTHHGELVVIPNVGVGQKNVRNFSRQGQRHLERLTFSFPANNAPNRVKEVMKQVACSTPGLATDIDPEVRVSVGGQYTITLTIPDFSQVEQVRDEYTTRLWYIGKREGIDGNAAAPDIGEMVSHLESMPALRNLDRESLEDLAKGTRIKQFGAGEYVIRQGERGKALYVVLVGEAVVTIQRDLEHYELARIQKDEFFGELALLKKEVTTASVVAARDIEVLEIDPEPFREMLNRSPDFARKFEATMYSRKK